MDSLADLPISEPEAGKWLLTIVFGLFGVSLIMNIAARKLESVLWSDVKERVDLAISILLISVSLLSLTSALIREDSLGITGSVSGLLLPFVIPIGTWLYSRYDNFVDGLTGLNRKDHKA